MYICKKCEVSINDVAKAMIEGCECGSRTFRQIGKSTPLEQEKVLPTGIPVVEAVEVEQDHEPAENIAILVKNTGEYAVNLEALIERGSGMEPLLVQDKKGVINVLFNPDT